MLVHISVTDPELSAHRDRLAQVLRDTGADVTFDEGSDVDAVTRADAVVCLIGAVGVLLDDGTHYGEHPILAALSGEQYTLAYEVAQGDGHRPVDRLEGYAVARIERLRRHLREGEWGLRTLAEPSTLAEVIVRDLSSAEARLRQRAPEAIRSLHRRIRDHQSAMYDAFSVSMHNVDQLYWVDQVIANREMPGKYHGAEPGGAGANTMVALRRLGLRTAVAGAVGDDADGTMLRRALADDEVDTNLLLTVGEAPTGRAVVLRAADGGYSNIVDGGANGLLDAELDQHGLRHVLVDTASRSRVLHFSSFSTSTGRSLQEALLHEVPDEILVSYKPGTMDADLGIDRLEHIFGRCDVLFVAAQEIDLLFGGVPGSGREGGIAAKLDSLFRWRADRGHERPLLIALIAGLEDPTRVDPIHLHWGTARHEGMIRPDRAVAGVRPEVTDTAGARDAIVAGVLFGLLGFRPPADCANLAYVLGVSACADHGCRRALLRSTQVRNRWRALMGSEPPRWLDPYG